MKVKTKKPAQFERVPVVLGTPPKRKTQEKGGNITY